MKTVVSKSEKIRDYIKSNPEAGPKAVADALTSKGIKVTPGHVSVIKNKMTKKAKAIKVKAKAIKVKAKPNKAKVKLSASVEKTTATPKEFGREDLVKAIMDAKSLVGFSGDLEKAKNFLELVSRL